MTKIAIKLIWKVLLFTSIGYAILFLLIFIFQRKLLYVPSQFNVSQERAVEDGVVHWPSFENDRGFISNQEIVDAKGTIIIFHGNAGTAYYRNYYIEALSRLGYRVILAEYPGYGGREGKPSEDILVKDAVETIQIAHQKYGEPLFLWGESLGSGVVSSTVSQTDVPLKGIVLFTPWDSLPNVAQETYWFFPVRWIVLDKYNNVDNLQDFSGNIAVIVAGQDKVTPTKFGKSLYDSIQTNKKLWLFENAGHNTIPLDPDLAWWKEVTDFIAE